MNNPQKELSQQKNLTPGLTPHEVQTHEEISRKQIYGDKFQDHLLEQYKLYVEMMDRTAARRNQMNNFYISLLSGLLGLIAIATNKDVVQFKNTTFQSKSFVVIAILGIILCAIWYQSIQSYRQLNSGKFKVINEIESKLPFSCYDREWEVLKKDKKYQNYLTQTSLEKIVPFLLAIPYICLLVYSFLNF